MMSIARNVSNFLDSKMKIFLTSMMLLLTLLNGTRANLNGQTNERVPLLNEDGTSTGTTITCSPYSVLQDTNDVEYVKYVLDTEEEGDSSVVWNLQPNKIVFEQCASYAADQNAGMFYFDGETCETSDTVYERKEKTCNSTSAKMVYMQRGFQPSIPDVPSFCIEGSNTYEDGDIIWKVDIPCSTSGRKRCENGVMIAEREIYDSDIYLPHMEGVDYFPTDDDYCFIKPQVTLGPADEQTQKNMCNAVGASYCNRLIPLVEENAFIEDLKEFLDSPVASSMSTSQLAVAIFKYPDTEEFLWGHFSNYLPSYFPNSDDPLENCIVFDAATPHDSSASNCQANVVHDICCIIRS